MGLELSKGRTLRWTKSDLKKSSSSELSNTTKPPGDREHETPKNTLASADKVRIIIQVFGILHRGCAFFD
jgi:hypothetical protein